MRNNPWRGRIPASLSLLAAVFALPAGLPARSQTAAPAVVLTADDIAKFISGLPGESELLRELRDTTEWKEFAANLDKSWADLESKRLKPMREWAAAELADSRIATRTLFYPFGGPDFLTALELYPQADTFVLLGLEFVGSLPALASMPLPRAAPYLQNVQASLSDFFNKSYFITGNMDATLRGDKVDGVLPVLCLFLKRMNNTIIDVKRCLFLEKGEFLEADFSVPVRKLRRPNGVKIEFLPAGAARTKSLYYFSCDLADEAFRPESTFHQYLDTLVIETTFIKSASYLLHYQTFSAIRSLILDKSRFVLEDDTGIPYRYFKPAVWEAQLFGEYIKPVKDFSGVEQTDLKAAYAEPAKVRVLPFHLGYHWATSKDSILYFRRKPAADKIGLK